MDHLQTQRSWPLEIVDSLSLKGQDVTDQAEYVKVQDASRWFKYILLSLTHLDDTNWSPVVTSTNCNSIIGR